MGEREDFASGSRRGPAESAEPSRARFTRGYRQWPTRETTPDLSAGINGGTNVANGSFGENFIKFSPESNLEVLEPLRSAIMHGKVRRKESYTRNGTVIAFAEDACSILHC